MLNQLDVHYRGLYWISEIKNSTDLDFLTQVYANITSDLAMTRVEGAKPKLPTMTDEQYETRLSNFKKTIGFGEMFLDVLSVRMDFLKSDYNKGWNEALNKVYHEFEIDLVDLEELKR